MQKLGWSAILFYTNSLLFILSTLVSQQIKLNYYASFLLATQPTLRLPKHEMRNGFYYWWEHCVMYVKTLHAGI